MSAPNRLARFLTRPPGDQLFAGRSLVVVALVRLGLSTIGYRRMRGLLPEAPAVARAPTHRDLARTSWAVTLAARFVPGATCLTQALAGHYLLARQGIASTVRVGAKSTADGGFAAHAWLLAGETVVLGGLSEDVKTFAPLVDLRAG